MSDPRPDLLAALPDLIADRIKVSLPDLRTCKGQSGRFDVEALKKFGLAAPAVLVATTRISQGQTYAGPHATFTIEMAAFVVTKDGLGLSRDAAAAQICQTLLAMLPDRTWSEPGVGPAEAVTALPLITAAQTGIASSLWAVTWRQPITFTAIPVSQPQPIELYVGQHPNVGGANADDYTQIGGGQ
ncbi:MAG: hypothetical protein JXR35_04010 [Rhodobacteraceae bacterium]|nr:hypothetical protein [Paracoccaceae bacterium]